MRQTAPSTTLRDWT